jgi:hypothetical protein
MIDAGDAFSNANFSGLRFNGSYIELYDVCDIIQVIGKYENVRRNLKTLNGDLMDYIRSRGNLIMK